MAAAISTTSNVSFAQTATDPNPSTTKFMQDAVNPYAATAKPAVAPKAAKAKKSKKKM